MFFHPYRQGPNSSLITPRCNDVEDSYGLFSLVSRAGLAFSLGYEKKMFKIVNFFSFFFHNKIPKHDKNRGYVQK